MVCINVVDDDDDDDIHVIVWCFIHCLIFVSCCRYVALHWLCPYVVVRLLHSFVVCAMEFP